MELPIPKQSPEEMARERFIKDNIISYAQALYNGQYAGGKFDVIVFDDQAIPMEASNAQASRYSCVSVALIVYPAALLHDWEVLQHTWPPLLRFGADDESALLELYFMLRAQFSAAVQEGTREDFRRGKFRGTPTIPH